MLYGPTCARYRDKLPHPESRGLVCEGQDESSIRTAAKVEYLQSIPQLRLFAVAFEH